MRLKLRLARLAGLIAGWLTVEFLLRVHDQLEQAGEWSGWSAEDLGPAPLPRPRCACTHCRTVAVAPA